MRLLWNEAVYFLTISLGCYYIFKQHRVFSQTLLQESTLSAVFNRCDKLTQNRILGNCWREAQIPFQWISLMMTVWLVEQGGVGALFWFLIFSFFLKYTYGVVAALAATRHDFFLMPSETVSAFSSQQKADARGSGSQTFLFGLFALLFIFFLLPFQAITINEIHFSSLSVTAKAIIFCFGICAAFFLHRLANIHKIDLVCIFSTIGLGLLLIAMVTNLQDFGLIILFILRDAIQSKVLAFPFCNRGWTQMLQAAAMMSAVSFLLQIFFESHLRPSTLPHPIFHTINAQLSFSFNVLLQFLLALVFLAGQTAPVKNKLLLSLIECLALLLLFSYLKKLVFIYSAVLKHSKLSGILLILGGLLLFVLHVNQDELFKLISALLGLLSMGMQIHILRGSLPYFLLLEDYRDVYVWHQKVPH